VTRLPLAGEVDWCPTRRCSLAFGELRACGLPHIACSPPAAAARAMEETEETLD